MQKQEPPDTRTLPPRLDIRQRLRQWEVENAATFDLPPELEEWTGPGDMRNDLTRPLEGDQKIDSNEGPEEHDYSLHVFDRDDLLDVGARRKFLRPGDLVELS